MVSSATLYGEIGIVLAAIFVILTGLYLLNRYMKRRGPELALREGRGVLDDRSHNQIRLGRSAAERLAREGVDVSEATRLLDRADVARQARNFEMSIELSSKAKDLLAGARTVASPAGSGVTSATVSPGFPAASAGTGVVTPPAFSASAGPVPAVSATPFVGPGAANGPIADSPTESPGNRPPRNKMEAHFQLSLVQDEIDQARGDKSRTRAFKDADALRTKAQAAYDAQDYTEALRLALKSRRTLGTRVEGLPVSPTMTTPAETTPEPGTAASQPTFGQKCAKCGRVASSSDQFCRGCGAPITPAVCSACGAPLLAGDRFCGKCGAVQT